MATNSAPGDDARPGSSNERADSGATAEPGLWPLISRHKRATGIVVGLAVLAIALSVVPALVGSSSGPLNDATTCSQWASASSTQQSDYARLYLDGYGTFSGAGRTGAAVQTSISRACVRAAYLGEADDVSILAAVRGDF
jgi:hypothetical protein